MMNESIMREAGFGKEMDRGNQGLCPFCNEQVNLNSFRDELSLKEYKISGLCQKCQDECFK